MAAVRVPEKANRATRRCVTAAAVFTEGFDCSRRGGLRNNFHDHRETVRLVGPALRGRGRARILRYVIYAVVDRVAAGGRFRALPTARLRLRRIQPHDVYVAAALTRTAAQSEVELAAPRARRPRRGGLDAAASPQDAARGCPLDLGWVRDGAIRNDRNGRVTRCGVGRGW